MNALTALFSSHLPRPQNRGTVVPFAARPVKRERDFGVGYGSSSGYATTPRYVSNQTAPRFRFG